MSQAPEIDEIRLKNVSANYVLIEWDSLGGVFTYEIQRSANGAQYVQIDFASDPEYFDRGATPSTRYVYRVRAVSIDYDPGPWIYTEEFETFEINSYAVAAQQSVSIYKNFIREKLNYGNNIVDFNSDMIEGVLIREGYLYSDSHTNIGDLESYILYEDEALKIYGDISSACGPRNKLMPAKLDDKVFTFERLQSIVRYTEDHGSSWKTHSGLSGRAGNPIGNQIAASSNNTLYIIGYDGLYTLNVVGDTRFSSTDDKFSDVQIHFAGGEPGQFVFGRMMPWPNGIASGMIDAIGISEDYKRLHIAALDTMFTLDLTTLNLDQDPNSPTYSHRVWESTEIRITGDAEARVKNLVGFGNDMYAYVSGVNDLLSPDHSVLNPVLKSSEVDGIYKISYQSQEVTRVYGSDDSDRDLLDRDITNLSRSDRFLLFDTANRHYKTVSDPESVTPGDPDIPTGEYDPDRVDSAERIEYDPSIVTTVIRPYRQPVRSEDGVNWAAREENYHYESQYFWYSGDRIWVNYKNRLCIIEKSNDFRHIFTGTKETNINGNYTFYADGFDISGYPGYTVGMAFYKKSDGTLIGFYNLGYRTRDRARFPWIPDKVVLSAALASHEVEVIVPEPPPSSEMDIVPPLEPFVYQMLPEHFIQNEPLYVDFVSEYLKWLSNDSDSDYGILKNLVRNHDVNDTEYIELFYNDLSRRNMYLNKDKWVELLKFVNNRAFDIYSIKGIKESYEFLFRFLYNADVVVTTESDSKYEFDIIIESNMDFSSKFVGNPIQTPSRSGRAEIVYYERTYSSTGAQQWTLTLNNINGDFEVGDTLVSPVDPDFDGIVVREVKGKEKPINNQEYLQRGPTYHNITIQSPLQVSRYKDDVIRFVHPVGFGFVGILLVTMFINSGISMRHRETIIEFMLNIKWDQGLPTVYQDQLPDLMAGGNYVRNEFGEMQYHPHPKAGQDFPLTPNYLTDNPGELYGQNASQRRKASSRLFDSSDMRFIESIDVKGRRLKDGTTQRKDQ